jgi:WD40 repeat protein
VLKDYLEDPPHSDILPPLPPSVADLLTGCFQTDPADRPQSMTEMVDLLQHIYREQFGCAYPRQRPTTTELKADTLNNRAASLLDLGRVDEAAKRLEEAWESHPWQPQVAHNRGLLLWRTGQITDRDLIVHLQELCRTRPLDWEAAYSMGQVQLERGEIKQALKSLEQAVGLGGRFEVQATLDEARTLVALAPRCVRSFTELPRSALRVYLSSDSRWVLAQIDEQSLCLCNALTGQLAVTFRTSGTDDSAGAVSSDGRWKLTEDEGQLAQLWDLTKNRKVRTFRAITWGPARRTIGGDGRLELSASDDLSIVLKDQESGDVLQVFWGHTDKINTVCLSADGEWVVSGGNDRTIRIWEAASGRCLRTFKAHAGAVRAIYLAADGHWALSTGLDRTLKLWNLELLRDRARRFVSPTALCHITSSEEAGRAQAEFVDLCEQAREAAGSGDYDEALERIRQARGLPGYEVGREAMDLWAMAGRHCRRKYFLDAWTVQSFEGHSKDIHAGILSADGRHVVSASWDNTVRVWEADTGHCVWTLEGHSDSVRTVSLDASGTRALSGSWDKTLRLWDIENGTCLDVFEGHGNCVTSAHLSPDGRQALSGSWDQRLRFWDLESRRCLQSFGGHQSHINSVFLSSSGLWALSGSEDQTARLWELASGECLRVFEGHEDWVTSVWLSADNRWVLTGSKDWTLRLWDVSSGECQRVLKGHKGSVNAVCLSSDGRWALSGSRDRTVRLWQLESGSCAHVFEGHAGGVTSVFLSPDCRWMLSGSEDWGLRLWELDWEYDFPGWKDWDEAARPYLEVFLAQNRPLSENGGDPPEWDSVEFHGLMRELQDHGLGFLRAQGVRDELAKMLDTWDGPPQLRDAAGRSRLKPRKSP